jgi:ABC-type dipeptide/oligopeptide/nickel transport system permease component
VGTYIIRRLLQSIPTFFGITAITFLLIITAPGDPVSLITFGDNQDPETIESLRRLLGLDQPPITQYVFWLVGNDWTRIDLDGDGVGDMNGERRGLLRGDLGNSLRQQRPVFDLLMERIPATLQLTVTALVIGYGLGMPLGVLSAVNQGRLPDQIARVISVLGNAVPGFWLGLLLIIVFSVTLRWLPMGGSGSPMGGDTLLQRLSYMIMPVLVLSLPTLANVSRIVRTSVLEIMSQDYIRTARAKGLGGRTVIWRHAVRNALIPTATFLGAALGGLLGGTVIVERVFSWPGIGRLVVDSVFQRDYPIVMGSVVLGAVLFILGTLLSDVLYGLLDPRIRLN